MDAGFIPHLRSRPRARSRDHILSRSVPLFLSLSLHCCWASWACRPTNACSLPVLGVIGYSVLPLNLAVLIISIIPEIAFSIIVRVRAAALAKSPPSRVVTHYHQPSPTHTGVVHVLGGVQRRDAAGPVPAGEDAGQADHALLPHPSPLHLLHFSLLGRVSQPLPPATHKLVTTLKPCKR